MNRLIPLLFLPAIAASPAAEIRWTAAGTVSSVNGSGFTAMAGDPVSVTFTYDSAADAKYWDELDFGIFFYARTEFHGSIGLTMEVTIGASSWKGVVPVASNILDTHFAISSIAWAGGEDKDTFSVTASSVDSGTFTPFPYSGSATDRSIQVVLRDILAPSNFLAPKVLPGASTEVSEITDGSGSITAGADSIQFTIDPASVTVASDEPRIPLSITRTLSGIELRWPTEDGVSYRLEESDALSGWQTYGSYPGTGAEIVVPLNPFDDHPERRFYRVVTE